MYIPSSVPASTTGLLRWLADELRRIANAINDPNHIELKPRGTEPLKRRAGMIAYADGTLWDPGAGEGAYEYRSDNAWHKL